ncbi:helix-turn-helix domain-containing protein [Acidobacteriia bacterium AH_259_A11_L15]|nr:helix-turn-helix domain-containing protein [Acidobacteriia bacterium AH_259_A11_L15]
MRPGERLRGIRNRLGITTRAVEDLSQKIAEAEGNQEFYISNPWLTQLENKQSTPSIYKLYSLSVIYRTKFSDLLLLFGVDLERISKHEMLIPLQKTHPVALEVYDRDRAVAFPVRFDPGFKAEQTALLSRLVEIWGEIPISLIQHLDIRRGKYGYIGLKDYMMYPLLRPGSFVQIDDQQKMVRKVPWRTEYDRPIYFVEFRDGYACSWCELQRNRLSLVPHPLSPCSSRQYEYPTEAEIVGRVTAVAMRIVDYPNHSPEETPRLPRRP